MAKPRSLRRKLLIIVTSAVGICLLALAGASLYLFLSDLSWARTTVEELATRALGREVAIAGEFSIKVRSTVTLAASKIQVANIEGGSEPSMVTVDHLGVRVNLLSLLSGPLRIHQVEIDGARILLEQPAEGAPNWSFETTAEASRSTGPPEITVERIDLNDLHLVHRSPSAEKGLDLAIAELACRSDAAGVLDLELNGAVNGADIAVSGRLGTLAGLLGSDEAEIELSGRLAEAEIDLRARFQDLRSFDGAELEVEAHGEDVSRISRLFDPAFLGSGPFRVRASFSPAAQGSNLSIDTGIGDVVAKVDGVIDSLTDPTHLDLKVSATGPDLAAATALVGLEGAPAEDFAINGRVVWQGFPITFDAVEVRVGPNDFEIDGVLGEPPSLSHSELELSGSGPDASALGALAKLLLPAVPYEVSGRLARTEGGVKIESAEVRLGATHLEVSGRIGDPPEMHGTLLAVHAVGPSLAPFSSLARIDLPDQAFEIKTGLIPTPHGLHLEEAKIRLGTTTGRLNAEIVTRTRAVGSRFDLEAVGEDASELAWAYRREELPALPFAVRGVMEIAAGELLFEPTTASLGELDVSLAGRIGLAKGGVGTDLKLSLEEPDTAVVAAVSGLKILPRRPIRATGGLRLEKGFTIFDQLEISLGDLELEISGSVAKGDFLHGTELDLSGRGPRLADLDHFFEGVALPDVPFTVSGAVRTVDGQLHLPTASCSLAGHRASVEGIVAPTRDLVGSDLRFEIEGPDLGELGRYAAGFTALPELPGEPYTLSGDIAVKPSGYDLRLLNATLSEAHAVVEGHLTTAAKHEGSDLSFDFYGPNASLFTALSGVTIPVAPFEVHGRIGRDPQGVIFHDLNLRLGDYRAFVDGSLGEAPRFVGSKLMVEASGPNLELVEQLSGAAELPNLPFHLSASVNGSPERFQVDDLNLQWGKTGVLGFLHLDLSDRPRLEGRLHSENIDIGELSREAIDMAEASAESPTDEPKMSVQGLHSDRSVDLSWLTALDAEVDWTVSVLQFPISEFRDTDLRLALENGRLQLGPFESFGTHDGRLSGQIRLEPRDGSYDLSAYLALEKAKYDLTMGKAADTDLLTDVDCLVDLRAQGRTPHELSASASGRMILSLAGGATNSSILDFIAADLVLKLLKTLNPFAGENKGTVDLDCAVFVVDINHGLAVLEPMAVKSENVTILGRGALDLASEKLDFEWVTKPRKGFGISASTITNPYVKLSGTLSKPVIDVNPVHAITSTGVAVATGGLSLLGKGLWDRLSSERKVCKKCLKEARRRLEGKKPKRRSLIFQ